MESTSMTSKYMNFSPQLVNERNAALNNCPTKSGRSQIYKNYYIKMKDAYKKYEEAIEDDEEDDEEDEDDEDYEPSEDEEYEEEYEASEADTSECETEDASEADQEYEASACEREVPDQDANACETEADQEYCCCCEAAYAYEEEASEAADEVEAGACETEEEEENEFGCPGCNYEWRDGYKNGWKDAMKYIAGRTHKEVPDTPACSYCDIVCKTRKCGGKCGGVVRYCSVDCQKQDWAFGHKNICGK